MLMSCGTAFHADAKDTITNQLRKLHCSWTAALEQFVSWIQQCNTSS